MLKDKNTVIGFVLLGVLFFAYFFINSKQSLESQKAKELEKRKQDSIALAQKPKLTAADTLKLVQDSINNEQQKLITQAGNFKNAVNGTVQNTTIENELVKISFTNKGGRPAVIILKNHKNAKGQPVQLMGDAADKFGYNISTGTNAATETNNLFFEGGALTKDNKGNQVVTYQLKDSSGKSIVHEYSLAPNTYGLNVKFALQGATALVTNNTLNFNSTTMVQNQDNDRSYEAQGAQFVYLKDGDFDYYTATETRNFNIEKPIEWFGYKQRFFSTLFLGKGNSFKNAKVDIKVQTDSASKLYLANTNIALPLNADGTINMQLYAGPNDYAIVKDLGKETRNIVTLHSTPFGFVKWINRGVIMPVFNWLLKNVGSVGLAIALLTLFIRILTAPLMMPGYMTSAKMKILRPEIDALKAKFGADQQGFALEQMKFLKQAGVNQFAGCLPSLLQIPIFFALFALFTAHIGVRGENFLWAKDLSMYDSIISWKTSIWPLGNHISLFALTASITSFLISWYSMSMTPDTGNPVMKYLPYIFPVIMFFIFNNLPSALNWYYTVSNAIALILQLLIQKVWIKPEKLKAQIEINKKTVKPRSKFQERYEQMMELQKQANQNKKK
jgi:YidC/Oxa1 family membrane protein insertase